mmetsp:Transcript_88837/g.177645  ORF Transcript_88837/g.177645 Transcript_88837/m.177645 type:complete len:258 (+) Transcript_88837:538-1311(+)
MLCSFPRIFSTASLICSAMDFMCACADGSTDWMVFSCSFVCSMCARHSFPSATDAALSRGPTRSSSVFHTRGSMVFSIIWCASGSPTKSSSAAALLPPPPVPPPSNTASSVSSTTSTSSSMSPIPKSASSSTSASSTSVGSSCTGAPHTQPRLTRALSHKKSITLQVASPYPTLSFATGKSREKPWLRSASIILFTEVFGSSNLSTLNALRSPVVSSTSHSTSARKFWNCTEGFFAGNAKAVRANGATCFGTQKFAS